MAFGECRHHRLPVRRIARIFFQRGQLRHLRVSAGGVKAERANTLSQLVRRRPHFRILLHEQCVELLEMRAFHIPVISMGFQIERVSVRQQA